MTPSPTSAIAVDAAALADALARYRVFSLDRLRELTREFSGSTAAELAEHLVSLKELTQFQADRVLAGETRTLALGPYRLTGLHRRGALGPTLRAERGGTAFAVRILPLRSLWQAKQAKQLARTLAGLPKQPSIVPLVDADSANGRHYLVWPLTEGESLADLVRVAGPFLPAEAANLLARLAAALAACHARQVVHGLLTPHAVALGADNTPTLLDLGAGMLWARNLAAQESIFDTMTATVAVAGMLGCAAPEWVADPTNPTPAGDQFSLGAVGYFALTGELPATSPRPVAEVNPAVPTDLAAVIDRLLRTDPAERFSGMDEAQEVLAALVGSLPPPVEVEPATDLPSVSRHSASRAESSRQGGASAFDPVGLALSRPVERDNTDSSVQFDLPDAPPEPVVPPPRIGVRSSRSLYNPVGPIPHTHPATADTLPTEAVTPTTFAPRPPAPVQPGSRFDGTGGAKSNDAAAPPVLPPAPLIPESAAKKSGSRLSLPTPGSGSRLSLAASASGSRLSLPTPGSDTTTPAPQEKQSGSVLWKAVRRKALFWRVPTDSIQVSVFGPEFTAHSETPRLTVFVHPPTAGESVQTLARAFHHDAVLLGTGPLGVEVSRGDLLSVHVAVAHTSVTNPMATASWKGQPQRLTFDLVVPWGAPVGPAAGVISVGRADVRIGKVEFHLPILDGTG